MATAQKYHPLIVWSAATSRSKGGLKLIEIQSGTLKPVIVGTSRYFAFVPLPASRSATKTLAAIAQACSNAINREMDSLRDPLIG